MINKYPKTSPMIEDELRKAFRNAGFGNVDVTIEKFAAKAGYMIDTSAEFWIKITKSRLPRKDISRASNTLYKIVRRKPRQ